jgi:hypothetical protein
VDCAVVFSPVAGSTSVIVTRNAKVLTAPWKLSAREYFSPNPPFSVAVAGNANDPLSSTEQWGVGLVLNNVPVCPVPEWTATDASSAAVSAVAITDSASNAFCDQAIAGGAGELTVSAPYVNPDFSDHFGTAWVAIAQ